MSDGTVLTASRTMERDQFTHPDGKIDRATKVYSIQEIVEALVGQVFCEYFQWLNRGGKPAAVVCSMEQYRPKRLRA